jgi:ribosomal peptide maturation radical SAM protein 1
VSDIFSNDLSFEDVWIPYESGRGCWWGQKHHCHFCGLSNDQIRFRQKSAEKVLSEIHALVERSPSRNNVLMVDNIMPAAFYSSLLPRLKASEFPGRLFYEQKANISFERMELLYDAGVRWIQPGIESLSDRLLVQIEKGTSRAVNIATLRYASICGIGVVWNLLCEFPGDVDLDYSEQLDLIPLLRHLAPPSGVNAVSIDRFSLYHERPSYFGISGLRPAPAYSEVYPKSADLDPLAYYFEADYQRVSRSSAPSLVQLVNEIERWRSTWNSENSARPALFISKLSDDEFAIFDTRVEGAADFYRTNRQVAEVALFPSARVSPADYQVALEHGLFVELKEGRIPLATCSRELYKELACHL